MKKILKGHASLFREIFGLRNDGSFLTMPASLAALILICGVIGLIRNWLSVQWKILPGFYSLKPDILWTMFNFPVYLFLFPSALLHWQLRLFGYQGIRAETVFSLSLYLQILHLIIPALDWAGYKLGLPWAYTIGTEIIRTAWYTNRIYMTPGIIIGWWVTAYMVSKTLWRMKVNWFVILFASLTTFLAVFLPTYVFFTGLNTIFNRAFGLWFWNPQDYLFDSPSWFLQWGNGTYFGLGALLGLWYYVKQQPKSVS